MYIGEACRTQVNRTLSHRFTTPALAEEHFNYFSEDDISESLIESISAMPDSASSRQPAYADDFEKILTKLDPAKQMQIISELFSLLVGQSLIPVPPPDFLELVILGMKRLHSNGRSNVIYLLAKAIGTMRPQGTDSLLPISRMPMGLLDYVVNFYTASSINKVYFT